MRLTVFVLLLATQAACSAFPELDAAGPDPNPPPQLLPMDRILAQAGAAADDPGPALAARAARAKARAAALRSTPAAP